MTSPVVFYIVYKAGYQGRAGGHLARLIGLTGREATWRSGIALTGQSPFVGWGFHADRLLLHSEHMHNSYLHALLQGGIIGALFFVGALVSVWFLILRNGLIKKIRHVQGRIPPELAESILLIGFLTSRSFFESTAAFYGVDLLVIVPAITYIYLWIRGGATDEKRAAEMSIPVRSLA
jgi:O-antigen ligase